MRIPFLAIAVLLAAAAFLQGDQPGQPDDEEIRRLEARADEKIAELKGKNRTLSRRVDDEAVRRVLPGRTIFGVCHQMYPVALPLPADSPLKNYNLLIWERDGAFRHLASGKELEQYFKDNLAPAVDEMAMKDAARAWLRIAQELVQDGFFRFELIEETLQVADRDDGRTVTGRLVVSDGGNGDIRVEMRFGRDGKLEGVTTTPNLYLGDRPRCQATRLLDPDPLVRYMAEQALLHMGPAARDYLDEQRNKASPELRQAIDQIWERIEERRRRQPAPLE